MRPHFIEIQAFGPYVELQRIDFDKFSGNNLFLLHGPTGAGKTTIFDAMSCALFGGSTSARNHKQMRSDFAPPGLDTLINFSFTLRGRRFLASYKIRQKDAEPEHILFATDADGNKREKIVNGTKKVKEAVQELLKVKEKEFLQIVILPQGEFQKFLQANGKSKGDILGAIFGTQRFSAFQEILKNKLKNAQDELKMLQSKLSALQLGNLPQDSAAENYLQTLEQKHEQLTRQIATLQTQYNLAREKLQEAQNLVSDFATFRKCEQELKSHEASRAEYEFSQSELTLLEKAAKLKNDFDRLKQLKDELKKAEQDKKSLEEELAAINQQIAECIEKQKLHEARKTDAEDAYAQAQKLKDKLPDFEAVVQLSKTLDQLRKKTAQARQAEEDAKNRLLQVAREQEDLKVKIEQLKQQTSSIPLLQNQLAELKKQADNLAKLQQEKENLKKSERVLQKAFAAYEAKRQEALQIQQQYDKADLAWRKAQAAQLAQKLSPGMPCPVCGSLEHPNPAPLAPNSVSDQELEQLAQAKVTAERHAETAREQYNTAKTDYESQKRACEILENQLNELAKSDAEQFQKEINTLSRQLEEAHATEETLVAYEEKQKRLAESITDLENSVHQNIEKHTSLQAEWRECEGRYNLLVSRLPADIADAAEARKKITALEKIHAEWNAEQNRLQSNLQHLREQQSLKTGILNQLEVQLKNILQERENLLAQTEENCRKEGFDDVMKAYEAVKQFSSERLESLRAYIKNWENKQIALQTNFEQACKKVEGKHEPDVMPLTEQVRQADEALGKARHEAGRIVQEISHLQKILGQISELEQQIKQQMSVLQPLQQLSELAEGKNYEQTKLHHFVLQFYFEQVLQAANLRLRQLSGGRYELHNDATAQKASERDGLKIVVFDQHTGTMRPVENLSGGETFFTSLALALGLSDVITSQSGGIGLEAMFIDEGFGTLDSETLDIAIRTLTELEGSRRLIGIISHVNELKERIPAKIEVRKGQKGSKIVQA